MRNVFDANVNEKSTIECPDFLISILKSSTPSFVLDWKSGRITCANQVSLPFREGGKVQSPATTCVNCTLRSKCTTSKRGRSVSIHPDEKSISELRERQLTTQGRAKLRERVAVEHSSSHIGRWQGDKARYLGVRKNLFDLRRTAVVHNLRFRILNRCSRLGSSRRSNLWHGFVILSIALFFLPIDSLLQVAVWAASFVLVGEFSHYGEAFYHSAVNFATLGYGDIVMKPPWRLLGSTRSG